jgi:hypothetical protein
MRKPESNSFYKCVCFCLFGHTIANERGLDLTEQLKRLWDVEGEQGTLYRYLSSQGERIVVPHTE